MTENSDSIQQNLSDNNEPWYIKAFGNNYSEIYGHRNASDAERAISFLSNLPGFNTRETKRVLDLCCGAGRHSMQWRVTNGVDPVGMDLSPQLLVEARADSSKQDKALPLARGDMRALPFIDNCFSLVLNIFTSFGYFTSEEENNQVIAEVSRVLNPAEQGIFIFDHINPTNLKRTLVPESERESSSGLVIKEKRWILENEKRVEKELRVIYQDREEIMKESVRFYEADEFAQIAAQYSLERFALFGDFDGSKLKEDSPRAISIFRKR